MMFKREEGFTLVELMVVVLIIGILVAIAVPVFLSASAKAEARACQANQRTIVGAMTTAYANDAFAADVAAELLDGKGAVANGLDKALITAYIKAAPVCKTTKKNYVAKMVGGVPSVTTDSGDVAVTTFDLGGGGHVLP